MPAPAADHVVAAVPAKAFAAAARARNERFDDDVLIPAIREVNPSCSRIDELLHRCVVIPQTKERLTERADELALLEKRPPFGAGRVDTVFSYKVHFGIREDVDDPLGTVDLAAGCLLPRLQVYDYGDVGFVSDGEAASDGFRYDTTVRGNGNEGHTYGTDLSEREIDDLLEFPKAE